ncbi:MAG: C25 family cysteine peptidase [Chitinophagales bacterium]
MKTLTILFCLIFSVQLFAQEETYFNEWIDYEQTYYKFRIAEDGLYRIPYSTLQQANLAEKSPEGFHLFSRGEEVPIFLSSNETFGSEDFIEFYGQKNDGSFDTQLFQNSDWQLTDRKSLFTDSIGYYLMWDDGFEGERIEVIENDLSGELPEKDEFFMYESALFHRNIFNVGEPLQITSIAYWDNDPMFLRPLNFNFADFEKGEGLVGSIISGEKNKTYKLPTLGVYRESNTPSSFLQTKMVGKYSSSEIENIHHFKLHINNETYIDTTYEKYEALIFDISISTSDLNDIRTDIIYESVGNFFDPPSFDWQSVSYTFLTYPRQFDFSVYASGEVKDATEFYFELQHLDEAYFEGSHFNGGSQTVLYDLNNNQRMDIAVADTLYKIHLPQSASMGNENRKLFLANTDEELIRTIDSLQSIEFTDYQKLANQGNYILLSHPSLREGNTDWVETYGNYRSTSHGGNHSVVIADIEELYDQFAHGILKHPLAIRHFVNFAVDKWAVNPEYLFLIGKGISYRTATTSTTFNDNLIPTFGYQPSDIMLAVRNIFDFRPQLGVGRLSARTPEDVKNYFNKMVQYENIEACTIADRAWRKHALFQNNGDDDFQVMQISAFLDDYEDALTAKPFGAKILDQQSHKNYSEDFHTTPFIEQGISVFQFSGQASGINWKTDILEDPTNYNQPAPRFPVIFSAAAFVGNVFKSTSSTKSLSESWVSAPNKGAIGFLGELSFDFWEGSDAYLTELYKQFSKNNYHQPIGKCLKETIENIYIANPNDQNHDRIKAAIQTFVFEGDPALIIGGGFDRPEYVIDNNYDYSFIDKANGYVRKTEKRDDIQIFTTDNLLLQPQNEIIEVEDKEGNLQLKVRVTNLGKAIEENFTLQVSRRILGETEMELIAEKSVVSPFYEKIYIIDLPYLESTIEGEVYEYFVQIDPNNTIAEDCEDNNEVVLQVRFSTCFAIAPLYENLEITNLQSNYCITDPAIQFQANIGGGMFAIEQIGGPTYHVNVFQPSQLGGGDFVIYYTITDNETGCVFTVEVPTTIHQPIAAIESIDLTEVCVGDAIQINAAPTEGDYIWNFSGGNFNGTPQNPIVSWDTPGEKHITLKVLEDGCASTTISQLIRVYAQIPENFPISCESDANSIRFDWEVNESDVEAYLIYGDGVLLHQLEGNVSEFTFENLSPEQVVSIEVVVVPKGSCEQVSSSLTCKTVCAGEIPVLDIIDTYCGSNPMLIEAPVANGSFTIYNPDGSITNVEGSSIFSSIFQDGISTIVFEYSDGECTYTSNEYDVIVSNPEVQIEGNTVLCPDDLLVLEVPEIFAAYQWNVPNANSHILGVSEAGVYSVIVTDYNGCTATDEIEIVEAEDPKDIIFTSSTNTILCDGEDMILLAPSGYVSYIWSGNTSIKQTLTITAAGNYYVDYEDENGCIWRAEIAIKAAEVPKIEVSSSEEMAVLSVAGNFVEYAWNTGENTPSITVTANGTYTVTTTDEYGCISTTSTQVLITNIASNPQIPIIEVYPNPFEDELVIEGLKGGLLQLYNIQGKLIFSTLLQKNTEILDWKTLQSGVYVLQLSGKKGGWTRKVVKK